ncbi:adhesion G-protein coupled receptor G5 isoform X5 [Cavia porcellus]|uniref:adhesion G-protein coupled receptor G5 isoform X5 n=1 Tax=Cavia porcellus TaxID=10141 RepID=UPI002FE3BCFE
MMTVASPFPGQEPVLGGDLGQSMDCCGALFFLCLLTLQGTAKGITGKEEVLGYMRRMEQQLKGRKPPSVDQVHNLEQKLLNATFNDDKLNLSTNNIHSLVFKLGCNFTGLSLSSAALEKVPQARARHAMHFPAELTRDACSTPVRPRELRLICIYFFTNSFFQDDKNSSLLNNYVLGAQLDQRRVKNLRDLVNISFWHNQSLVLCRCNHLTYFAVLMQLSPAPVPAELLAPLQYISLVGCSVSVVASLLTMVLHLRARKPNDSTRRIHMNLQISVLLLNVTFLLSAMLAVPAGAACVALAAVLHYALLSCLTWMAIEGFNLYLLLGRVYNVYIHRYVLKLCTLGWGVPALLVLLVLAVKSSVYGLHTIPVSSSQENGTSFQNVSMCWVRSPSVHGVLVMGYSGFTTLFNLVVLAWALGVLRRLRLRTKGPGPQACRDTVTVLGLTVLLGTTWALAFFSFGVFLLPQLFLFSIFNSLYGFFFFLWFCSQKYRSEVEVKAEMEALSSS